MAFAQSVLEAGNAVANPAKIIAIAIGVNTFACLLHSISRRWGIWLNNLLGTIKFCMLIFFIIIGCVWAKSSIARENLTAKTTFSGEQSPTQPYLYSEAILFALFPFSGFHQVNYVSY